MSNLFKSKFLLGVAIVAVMFVGALALATPASADCSITMTLRVGSTGLEVQCLQTKVGATADGQFGPLTKAAVMAWQAGHGLSADGVVGPLTRAALMGAPTGNFPAGCTSAAGFSPLTGLPCNSGPSTGLPAGCSTTAGYSPLTGTKCDSTGSTPTPSTGTDEGELKNFDSVSADENNFSEGETNELYAFEMEADGSDMMVSRVDIYLGQTTTAESNNADDYFDSATLLVDGDEVATLDVSDWDEDDWDQTADTDNDEFRLRFAGDFTVAEGDVARVTVEFDSVNNIDTADSDNATWEIDLATDSVRATDEAGFSDEFGESNEKTVTVDEVTTGDLDVSLNTDNPEEQIVAVDATDDTNGVEMLAFDLEANDGDISIDTLTVTVDDVGTLTNVDSVVNTLHLFRDGVEIASESILTTAGVTEPVTFDIDEDDNSEGLLEDGDTAEFTVEADINNLAVADTDFDEGDGILVSFTSVSAEDEAGDNVEADGTAAGENFHFYTVAPQITKTSVSITKVAGDNTLVEGTDDTADGTIVFTVKAVGGTIYINGDNEATAEKEGILLSDGTNDLDAIEDYSYTVTGASVTTTNGGADNEYFTIPEGATATFSLSFHLDPATDGFFGGNVTDVQFGTALTDEDTRSASSINFGTVADDLETSLVQLDDAA